MCIFFISLPLRQCMMLLCFGSPLNFYAMPTQTTCPHRPPAHRPPAHRDASFKEAAGSKTTFKWAKLSVIWQTRVNVNLWWNSLSFQTPWGVCQTLRGIYLCVVVVVVHPKYFTHVKITEVIPALSKRSYLQNTPDFETATCESLTRTQTCDSWSWQTCSLKVQWL